jgi:hypothetical protein
MATKTTIIAALDAWIRQRPGLEFGNYGDWTAYRSEMRSIGKDLQHARAMLNYVAWHDSITAEMILDAARSGQLSIAVDGDKVSIDYCTGQYWPTEYRPAVCRLLSSVIWHWMVDNMPEGQLVHNSETGETFHRYQGLRAGDYLRKQASRELGTGIARRWFA